MSDKHHSYNSGRINRAGQGRRSQDPPQNPPAQSVPPRQTYTPPTGQQNLFDYDRDGGGQGGRGAVYDYEQDQRPRQGGSIFDYDDIPRAQGTRAGASRYEEPEDYRRTARRAPQGGGQSGNTSARRRAAGRQGATRSRRAQQPQPYDPYLPPPAKMKRRKRWPIVLASLLLVFVLLGAGAFAVYRYITRDILDPGLLGVIKPVDEIPKEYSKKDVVHILIIGIDNEEGRDYGAGLGLTDMLLYCRYNIKENQLNMLQIPRDSYVGEDYPTNGTGKINALLISGEDKEHRINNLTTAFQKQFQLPVDHYIALDMDSMKAIVNTFGGLYVFVPREMSYGGSYLPSGWQWLDGDQSEFFVRNRHGTGFERGDIDRLDNQRHFYSALFRRFLNLTPKDIVNLLPVFDHYCNTDMELNGDMIALAIAALNLSSENVLFCKAPGATGEGLDPTGQGRSNYYIDLYGRDNEIDVGLANLLNTYFRDADKPVAASALGLPPIHIPDSYALYPPNVQSMGEVQAPEGGTDVDVEWQDGGVPTPATA